MRLAETFPRQEANGLICQTPSSMARTVSSPASFRADTVSPSQMSRPEGNSITQFPLVGAELKVSFFSLETRVLVFIDLSGRHYSIKMKSLCPGVKHEAASPRSEVG